MRDSRLKQQLGDVPAGHKQKKDSLGRQCSVGAYSAWGAGEYPSSEAFEALLDNEIMVPL